MKANKKFKLVGGRWNVGNLYDTLVAASFDRFINMHRQHNRARREHRSFPLYVYNYRFEFKNID